jgi:uncharacterized repeat protein (TIGR01451 family)
MSCTMSNFRGGLLALLAALSLSLCSCRGIPGVVPLSKNRPAATKEALEQAATAEAPIVSSREQSRPQPAAPHLPVSAAISDHAAAAVPETIQQVAWQEPPALPPGAYTGQPFPYIAPPPPAWSHAAGHHGGGCPCCSPRDSGPFQFGAYADGSMGPNMNCAPDGLACPWPADEYICDGGDYNLDANVRKDWTVVGLDQEDTVAHYDTLDGRTEITESNKICIYAPRFAAVRKVISPVLYEGHERMMDIAKADKLNLHRDNFGATTAVQPEQIRSDIAIDQAQAFRERNRLIGLDATDQLYLARHGFLPFEDLQAIQRGVFEAGEKARLAERTQAALVWEEKQAVQVIIDGKMAAEGKGTNAAEETVVYELDGKPRLRIVKIADKSDALPGEIVNFTLRFDNLGDQPVGNVTIVDNLTTRLEYVEGSQSCSVKADFATEENEGESLVLRWAVLDPLKVNEGGIIRFQCRVR